MGTYMISTREIAEALDTTLDDLEGDFTNKQLLEVLEVLKLYPFVKDKYKSSLKYARVKNRLGEQE